MFDNYIKITVRNFLRNKTYSLINLLGLAIGIACTILILLFVQDELSYDSFHTKKDRIVRITREWLNRDGTPSLHLARVAPPIGPLLETDYPDIIEEMVRVRSDYSTRLQVGSKVFIENRFFWAEDGFFNIFDFELIEGDKNTALSEPNTIVISEEIAERFFGDTDPLGQIVNYEDQRDLMVTGVFKKVPENSHFKFDILGSFITLYDSFGREFMETNWGRNNYMTYFLLRNESFIGELQSRTPEFLDKHLTARSLSQNGQPPSIQPSKINLLHVQRLTDIHLKSHLNSEVGQNGDITNVYMFSAIALFIMLIACINFMNLSTARSAKRAKEIGMRKVLGAYKKQLIYQFIGESMFLSFLALVLALGIVHLVLPSLNAFIGKELALNYAQNIPAVLMIILITFLVGLISGSYPAFFLSSFRPVTALKGNEKISRGRFSFRTVMVIIQFTISITLLICMGIVYKQMEFFRNKKLGFNKDQVIIMPASPGMRENLDGLKSRLKQNSNIKSVAASDLIPSDKLLNSWGAWKLDGEEFVPMGFRLAVVQIDYDFLDTYEFDLVAGRKLSRDYAFDDSTSYILNEAAVKKLGWSPQEAVGKPIEYGGKRGQIIGVLKDFNFESLHNEIVPIIFLTGSKRYYNLAIRTSGIEYSQVIEYLKEIWLDYNPDYPFQYAFLDENFDSLYRSEKQLGEIFGIFSMLAVIIACLGLFGLASFSAEQRRKEIGIRKVLGASVLNILGNFSKEYFILILFSNVIAWPAAYFLMNAWLEDIYYKTAMGLEVFVLAGIIALGIALLTVSLQSLKAATTNPMESLKYE